MKKVIQSILLMATVCLNYHCAYRTNQYASIKDIYDPEERKTTQLMVGNFLSLSPMEAVKIITVSLDPGRVLSANGSSYYFLKLSFAFRHESYIINPGDSLFIAMDGINIVSSAYSTITGEKQISVFYTINPLDLIELGNSKSVHVATNSEVFGQDKVMDPQSIKNFKKFSYEIILSQDPDLLSDYRKKKKKAFFGLGIKKGYNLVGGYYTNFLQNMLAEGVSDFIAIGFGQTYFTYGRYKLYGYSKYPKISSHYKFNGSRTNKSNRLMAVFGLSYQKPSWILSFELAADLNYYYINDKSWDDYIPYKTDVGTFPYFKTEVIGGEIHQGFSVGLFLQAGPVWYHRDSKGVWTIGLSMPLRF